MQVVHLFIFNFNEAMVIFQISILNIFEGDWILRLLLGQNWASRWGYLYQE